MLDVNASQPTPESNSGDVAARLAELERKNAGLAMGLTVAYILWFVLLLVVVVPWGSFGNRDSNRTIRARNFVVVGPSGEPIGNFGNDRIEVRRSGSSNTERYEASLVRWDAELQPSYIHERIPGLWLVQSKSKGAPDEMRPADPYRLVPVGSCKIPLAEGRSFNASP